MEEKMALHTAARRYCLEHVPGLNPLYDEPWYKDRRWKRRKRELRSIWENGRGTRAQLELLGEILFQIEQIIPDDFSSTNILRDSLVEIAYNTVYDCDNSNSEQEKNHERLLFLNYIESLSENDLRAVTALPYRRVLEDSELAKIWQRLEQCWGMTAKMHWYPIGHSTPPSHSIALQEDWFAYAIPPDMLRAILAQNGVRRIWELREAGITYQYEMDIDLLVPWSGGGEHCWTSQSMDWLIYTSHESSITLCGVWMLNSIKQIWPEWANHIYTGYRYKLPPPFEG